jgi:predicted HicB family RNase H-like nuclease
VQFENRIENLHRAMELSINRMYLSVKALEGALSNHGEHIENQKKTIATLNEELQSLHASVDSLSSIKNTSNSAYVTPFQLQEQTSSLKAYCHASIERAAELQSEKSTGVEQRLVSEMHHALQAAQHEHTAELNRVQEKVVRQLNEHFQAFRPKEVAMSASPRKDEIDLLRAQYEALGKENQSIKLRLRELELLRADVSSLLSDEERKIEVQNEVSRRVEELESAVALLESRV